MVSTPARRRKARDEEEDDYLVKDSQDVGEPDGEPDTPTPTPTPTKSQKRVTSDSQAETDGYRKGSIVSVHLKNFITYDDCSFRPGPRLNVVIGPNGSGKSSIVCAFALGLGGATSLLGRAKDVSEYIKFGTEKATVTIELKGEEGSRNVVIRRDIKKDNSSEWRINGQTKTKNEVLTKIKSLDVQVENLCQFLPQDRVSSFAAMDPPELLIETEKAVGSDEHLHENHLSLIEKRKAEKEKDRTCTEFSSIVDDLKKKNENLERDVIRFQERQKLIQKIELLEKKKPWLMFDEHRQKALDLKAQMQEVAATYKKAEEEKKPLLQKIKESETVLKNIETSRNTLQNGMKKLVQEKTDKEKQLEAMERDVDATVVEIENLKKREESREQDVQKLKEEIKQVTNELRDLPTADAIRAVLDEKNQEMKNLNKELGQIQAENMATQDRLKQVNNQINTFQSKLKDADDVRKQALANLQKHNKDVYNAYLWVQNNQDMFQEKVFGPVCLDINVPDPLYAQYLEMTVPQWLLLSFVCQNIADRDKLLSELADKQKLPINAVYLPGAVPRDRRPDLAHYKQLGIACYLDDVFSTSAPIVKEVLIANASVDMVACGTKESVKHVEELLNSEIHLFYTPESRYLKSKSRYEGHKVSTNILPVKAAKFLSGVDMSVVKEAKRKIEEKMLEQQAVKEGITKCEKEEQRITANINAVRRDRDAANNDKKKAETLAKKIELKENQLAELRREEDSAKEEELLRDKLRTTNLNRAKHAVLLMKLMKQLLESQIKSDAASIERLEAEGAVNRAHEEFKAVEQQFSTLRRQLDEVQRAFEETRGLARKLRTEAEAKAPLTDELKAQLAELPNNIEELDTMITDIRKKVEMLYANPRVVEEYETRKKEIEDVSAKLATEKEEQATLKSEIAELKAKWLPPLEKLIGEINTTFSTFFREIGCVGEVVLDKHEDYDKYGIQIKVQFRNEDSLHALNSHLQSGGERSVSTMLYLISLQHLTPCPFRVVDEINQGMDPYNERMIFRQVVHTATRPGLPQYFLITPKLLPDLEYTPNMTILCVFNGPWMLDQAAWDAKVKEIFS